jgi:hypothetical protein
VNNRNLYATDPIIDVQVSRLLPIAEWLADPAAQEISINNGQVRVDWGAGAMRDTGVSVPETATRAVIRLLAAAKAGTLIPRPHSRI